MENEKIGLLVISAPLIWLMWFNFVEMGDLQDMQRKNMLLYDSLARDIRYIKLTENITRQELIDIDFKLDRIQRMEMYDKSPDQVYENESLILNGLYQPSKGFYCVWTENRTYDQINRTVNHELLHALIDKDSKHFCGVE